MRGIRKRPKSFAIIYLLLLSLALAFRPNRKATKTMGGGVGAETRNSLGANNRAHSAPQHILVLALVYLLLTALGGASIFHLAKKGFAFGWRPNLQIFSRT